MSIGLQSLSWQSTKEELNICRLASGQIDYDKFRKDGLEAVERHTKIPLVVYATDFFNQQKVQACEGQVSIDRSDIQGFSEVTKDLPDGPLDVMLHTPGGMPEVAESIVNILRARFSPIRFLVPVMAKSAGTMIALSGNLILMPGSAELGPIDPQFTLPDGVGGVTLSPAQSLIDQWMKAQQEIINDQRAAPLWFPFLQRLGTGLLQQCFNAITLSKVLVKNWMEAYMLQGHPDAGATAQGVVDYLASHNEFYSHGRRVSIQDLKQRGVKIEDICSFDPTLWHLVERAWYGIQHTFEGTGAFKLYENSRRRGLARVVQVAIVTVAPPAGKNQTQIPNLVSYDQRNSL